MQRLQADIERALECLLAAVRAEESGRDEFDHSVEDFFQGPPPASDPAGLLRDARRHIEWFLLERHSPSLRRTPAEAFHQKLVEEEPELERACQSLLDSCVGIFEVAQVLPGSGLVLSDLTGLAEFTLSEPEASHASEVGDLIAGRLFPRGDGTHVLSEAAGYFRNGRLRDALRNDLSDLRQRRASKVFHVSQRELEMLFFGAGRRELAEDPVGDARRFLTLAGLSPERQDEVFERLRHAPYDETRWAHGARDVLGEVLDELAFDTEVDIEAARWTLLQAWRSLAPRAARSGGGGERAAPTTNPRAAIEAFDAARRSGAPLEEVFRQLEQDLGLVEDEEEGEAGEGWFAPDFPGVVGAVIQEFLWEVALTEPERAQSWAGLERLGRFAKDYGLLEDLGADAILRFATFWVPEFEVFARAEDVRDLVEGLSAFCSWATRSHDLDLEVLLAPLERLAESLPRLWRANRHRQRDSEQAGELHELLGRTSGGRAHVRDLAGAVHELNLPLEIASELVPGDRLRLVARAEGELRVLCCYPAEIGDLALR